MEKKSELNQDTRYDRRKILRLLFSGALGAGLAPFLLRKVLLPPAVPDPYWGEGIRPDVRRYVRMHYDFSLRLKEEHGIPVWGTLAVALLESGVGTSYVAQVGNNHFGIKYTSDWPGRRICRMLNWTDPLAEKVECEYYRAYENVEQGFDDFSHMLGKPRYRHLFQLRPDDYWGWAHGLRACGYAQDPTYGNKLLKWIYDHRLYELQWKRPEPVA